MSKCWYCGLENPDEAAHCSECGRELNPDTFSEVDPQLQDPTLALVIVGTFRTVVDASMAKLRLEAAGIEACIPEEYTPQIFWYAVPSPLEAVTLRVAAKDQEAALKVLAEESQPPSGEG